MQAEYLVSLVVYSNRREGRGVSLKQMNDTNEIEL